MVGMERPEYYFDKYNRKVPYTSILKWALLGLLILLCSFALHIFTSLPDVTAIIKKNPPSTALIDQRKKEATLAGKKIVVRQQWVTFQAIPKKLQDSVRISEDASFYQHRGVDYHELKIVLKKSWEEKRFVRGASTITQQLAKNLYLSPDRNLIRKFKEYLIARRLENHLNKNRIFHLYLNVIELGSGIFGVEAASRHYFGKHVGNLTLEETVRLTAIIPKPLKESPIHNSHWLNWRARWILDALKRYGYIGQSEYQSVATRFQ